MAVKIRLKKMGSKKRPFYRIVVADAKSPRDGRFIETIGTYDSIKDPAVITVDKEKAIKWLNCGAQPTDTVKSILKKEGINKTCIVKNPAKKVEKKASVIEEKAPVAKKTTAATKSAAKKTTTKAATKTTTKKTTTKEGK